MVDALRGVADSKGATVAQLAIAWVLSRGEDVVPLVGARRRDRLAEALGALEVELTSDDLTAIERACLARARRASATTRRRWRRWTASGKKARSLVCAVIAGAVEDTLGCLSIGQLR
jgi:diketogulonate reductase-like aldo/keto reductase